jgi:hypothetical protein
MRSRSAAASSVGRLLADVVAAVDADAAHVVGPRAPHLDRVAVELLLVVADRPGDERRAGHASPGRAVRVVVLGRVHRQAEGDGAAAVVAGDREALVAERARISARTSRAIARLQ